MPELSALEPFDDDDAILAFIRKYGFIGVQSFEWGITYEDDGEWCSTMRT